MAICTPLKKGGTFFIENSKLKFRLVGIPMSLPTEPGPVAPYSNYPIQSYFYQPGVFYISNITRGVTTLVTTTTTLNYVVGQLVRLVIPYPFRAIQLDQVQGIVISVPASNQVRLNINSTQSNAYRVSPPGGTTPAQIVAVGDYNSGQINTGITNQNTYVPGSFINISPL